MQLLDVHFCSKFHTESLILELTFPEIVVKSKYFFTGDCLQSITNDCKKLFDGRLWYDCSVTNEDCPVSCFVRNIWDL